MTSLLEVTAETAARGKDGVIWTETEELARCLPLVPLCFRNIFYFESFPDIF